MDILPDSRAKEASKVIRGYGQNWIPIYCANCGVPGGKVPETSVTFAFWLCNDCYEKHGVIANTMAIPDEQFWAEQAEDA